MGTQNSKTKNDSASKERVTKQPGAPEGDEGFTGTPSAPLKSVKHDYDATNYQLINTTEVQYDSWTFKEKSVDFYGLLTLDAPSYQKQDRPGIDCVCVLDVSGSMRGAKISLLRKSMRRLVRNLGAKDRVCFITFDTHVRTLMGFTQMDERGKEVARNLVKDLRHGSSTNLAGGLVSGIETIRDNFKNEVTSVLLFTDGEANVGEQSIPGILKLAKEAAGQSNIPTQWSVSDVQKWLENSGMGMYKSTFEDNQVDGMMLIHDINASILQKDLGVKALHLKKFEREIQALKEKANATNSPEGEAGPQLHLVVNTFGFGANHNNRLLEKIASGFDGMYFYMKDEDAIVAGFANCLGGMLSTVVQEIQVKITPCKGVKDLEVHKDDKKTKNKDGSFTVVFGDLQSEEQRHILVSSTLPKLSKADPCFQFFTCDISYKNLVRDIDQKETLTATVNRTGKVGNANIDVDVSKNRVVAADAMSEAESLGELRKLDAARKVVNEAMGQIEKSISAKEEFCLNLLADLKKCLDGLKDEYQWDQFGKGYMMQNQKCLYMERAANFDATFAVQQEWNSSAKNETYAMFQRSDSMDSCEAPDRLSMSPIRNRRSASPIDLLRGSYSDISLSPQDDPFKGITFQERERSLSLSESD